MQLLRENPETGVALLRLNRPEKCNALSLSLKRELAAAFGELGQSAEVGCIVLAGNEQVFSSGADLNEYENASPADIAGRDLFLLWQMLARCPKPVIAAVRGFALGGGCELAMHADIIVAGESARFGLPEVDMGLIPGGGGTQRLARAVGKFVAMQMLLTGEVIDGKRAYELGLAGTLVPDGEVVAKSVAMAGRIAALPAHCLRSVKELVLTSMNSPLDAGLREEHSAFQTVFGFDDKKKRIGKFLGTNSENSSMED